MVSVLILSKIEACRTLPSKHQVIKLAGYLDAKTNDLLIAYQKQRMRRERISEGGELKSNLIKNNIVASKRYKNMMHELQQLNQGKLQIQIHKPASPLNNHIENMIFYDGHNLNRASERVIPDGSVQLFIELDGCERRLTTGNNRSSTIVKNAWVAGVQKKYLSYQMAPNQTILGIRFQTGGFYALTGVPQSEIEDKIIEAEAVFGPSILQLREEMLSVKNIWNLFRKVEEYLRSHMAKPDTGQSVVSYVCNHIDKPLNYLVQKSGYSHKHLIRLFKKHVGVTPKFFQRAARFNNALNNIHSQCGVINWTGISLDNGYFDQAHFIKEFRRFTGMNPGSYLATGSTCSKVLYLPG